MADIIWSPELETGFRTIDKQHQHWVGLFNDLRHAVRDGRGPEVIGGTLDALLDYSLSHFRTEEGLMRTHGFEGIKQHISQHKVFTDQVRNYKERVELEQWTLTFEVMDYMSEWLIEHITSSDRDYIPDLQEGGVT